jgi:Arylsulfotransferase (ASST)
MTGRVGPLGGIARIPRRFRVVAAAFAVSLVALGLAACQPVKPPGPPAPPAQVSTNPPLFPGFQPDVFDYVNRCDPTTATDVHVDAPEGTTVSVDGSPSASGQFSVQVPQDVGRSFSFVVTTAGNSTTHYVRCLPGDFPTWSVEKSGTPQAAFYVTTLLEGFGAPSYPVIFDSNGVPVWWLDRKPSSLMNPLPNNHFATIVSGKMEEYDLNGNVVRTFSTVGAGADFHDVLLLPNGNYVMATEQEQLCNLTSWGLGPLESCANHVLQELQPPATPGAPPVVVWSWDTSLHIPVTETTSPWRGPGPFGGGYRPWHFNSIEDTGDGFIVSFRHLDAVYKIDKSLGTIVWKLGGTARPESLQLVNDPFGGLGGQHDARVHGDGMVTIYDNGTNSSPSRPPRAARYLIDANAKTATLTELLLDGGIASSSCCGSARPLPSGNWVVGWGGNPSITEHRPDGSRVFHLHGTRVYRGLPLLPSDFTASDFRAGMDSQYPP